MPIRKKLINVRHKGRPLLTNSKKVLLLTSFLLISACASTPSSENSKKWEEQRLTEEYQREKKIYLERLGLTPCWDYGVDFFLANPGSNPNPGCLYPSSKLVVGWDDGLIIRKRTLGQELRQLKVLQVTPDGFVVYSPKRRADQIIFIHKTVQTGVVDDSYLDEANWSAYEYAGTYSYKTFAGSKTVHSFRRLTKEKIAAASKDLKFYEPLQDFFIENQPWDYVKAYK